MYTLPSNLSKLNTKQLSDAEYNNEWPTEKSFKPVKRFNDPRFGDVNVVKNSANQVLIVKEKMASSKNEITDDILYLKRRFQMNHKHLMKLVAYSTVTNKDLCSTTYISKGFYEFPKTDVYKELTERVKSGSMYSHSELIHLTYQILSGLQNVHDGGLSHGDVRPQLIGLDKQKNHFELLDRLADPTPIERCQSNNIVSNKELYLSPQLYKKLKGKDKTMSYHAQNNDIFALGLSILYLGTGNSIQDIYLPNGELEKRKLQEHVMDFDLKYNDENPILCSILKELLQTGEANKKNIKGILCQFITYDEFIKEESKGIPLKKNRAPQSKPQQSYVNSQQKPDLYQKDDYTVHPKNNYNETEKYQFHVEDNEDFDGSNSYMVKKNQLYTALPQNSPPPQQYVYTQQYAPQPRTTMTYVKSTPQQLNTYIQHSQAQYIQPTVTYVQSPTYLEPTYVQAPTRIVHANPNNLALNTTTTYIDDSNSKVIRRSFQEAPVYVRNSVNLNQTIESKVIKKRYVMREDGTVVEIDPNGDVNSDDIKKYFDNSYSKNTIAQYDNVDQALNSRQ